MEKENEHCIPPGAGPTIRESEVASEGKALGGQCLPHSLPSSPSGSVEGGSTISSFTSISKMFWGDPAIPKQGKEKQTEEQMHT